MLVSDPQGMRQYPAHEVKIVLLPDQDCDWLNWLLRTLVLLSMECLFGGHNDPDLLGVAKLDWRSFGSYDVAM